MTDQRFLSKSAFKSLVKELIKELDVYGTVDRDGFPAWGAITRFEDLVLFQTPTHLSAKEFTFPQKETLVRFDLREGVPPDKAHAPVIEAKDQVLIGLHSCDVHGMNLMDRVFTYGTEDANYAARRVRTLVIATSCMPDEYCFCTSVETDSVDSGFDLFLHRLRDGFLVRIGTGAGEELLKRHATTRKAKPAELRGMKAAEEKRQAAFKVRLEAPPSELPEIYSKSDESPVWDRIGNICYGCGSCNHVCPTCYCFDVRDELKTDLEEGERVRYWDGCTLEDFTRVAGGHNFRKNRAERLRHRFNRKFNYLTDRFGSLFCIGCGRCSRTCLVDINISEVTNELIRERKKG